MALYLVPNLLGVVAPERVLPQHTLDVARNLLLGRSGELRQLAMKPSFQIKKIAWFDYAIGRCEIVAERADLEFSAAPPRAQARTRLRAPGFCGQSGVNDPWD